MRMDQLIRITQLYDQVFAGKLKAIADSYMQDRAIMIAACASLTGTDTNEKIDVSSRGYIDIQSVEEYANILIAHETFDAINSYLAMLEAEGSEGLVLNESVIPLDEAALDNLKNYLIGICEKISQTLQKFITRVDELIGIDKKFLANNKDKILSNTKITETATLDNYYSYADLMNKVATLTFKSVSSEEIETKAENGLWQTVDDYMKTDGNPNLEGFVYNPNGGSVKEQIETSLRGRKQSISSDQLGTDMRANIYKYCTTDFPTIKEATNADMAALKQFGKAMDTYISTTKNSNDRVEFSTEVNVKSPNEVAAQNASFSYEDTIATYFNEVDIKNDTDPNTAGIPKNQAAANADNQKAEADEKKQREQAISKAVKSYIKASSQILSAKMNIAVEAYRQSMKILKWYVNAYNKQTENGKKNQANQQNNPTGNNNNNQNNKSISDAIG